MEEKSMSDRIDGLVETLKLYIVQNVTEVLDAALLRPLENAKNRLLVALGAGFLLCIASLFLALALSFLCYASMISLGINLSRELVWGLSFLFTFIVFGGTGIWLLRRHANANEGNG